MSQIINPHTGLPSKRQSSLSEQDLMKILASQRMRIDMLNQQNMQLGLYLEFIVEHLLAVEIDGEPLIEIDTDEFAEFAEKRFKEIQEELQAHQVEAERQAAEATLAEVPEALGEIQLNE